MSEDQDRLKRSGADLKRSGTDLDKRFPVALVLYVGLAALIWFTMDAGKVLVMGRPVEIRWIPLIIIGGLGCAQFWPVRRIGFAGTGRSKAATSFQLLASSFGNLRFGSEAESDEKRAGS